VVALFTVESVIPIDKKILLLEGKAEGEIKAGMSYKIPFNRSFGMTVNIDNVVKLNGNTIQLQTNFSDEEEFKFVFSMNIGHEIFEIYDKRTI